MKTILRAILIAWCVITMTLPVPAKSLLCLDSTWFYHAGSSSCIKLFVENRDYFGANRHCGTFRDAKNNSADGHLVYIFDEDTDRFVKSLLPGPDTHALIGLNDIDRPGVYKWGESTQGLTYTGWEPGQPSDIIYLRRVIIRTTGWRKFQDALTYFFCQLNAVVSLSPTITCPAAAEEGRESPALSCTVTFPEGTESPTLSVGREGLSNPAAVCNNTRCNPSSGYDAFTSITGNTMTSSITIKNVTRILEGRWTCSFEAKYITGNSDACGLTVFSLPEEPNCSHQFSGVNVDITCKTEKVYPQGECSWSYYRDNVRQTTLTGKTPEQEEYFINGKKYYRTTCRLSQPVRGTGRYTFRVSMNPQGFSSQTKTRDVEFSVAPPTNPPALFTSDGRSISSPLEVSENQTVRIRCDVNGGTPSVISTRLLCEREITDVNGQMEKKADGQSVTMEIRVTRGMDGHRCTCNAEHIASYSDTASVTLSVKFPAAIETFEIKGKQLSGSTYIQAGNEVTFSCLAPANPKPAVTLYRVLENKVQLTKVLGTELLEYKVTAFCNTSGEYACGAENVINTKESMQSESLKVRCPPEACDLTQPRPKIGVAVGTDVTIKLCVFAYPEPTRFELSTDSENGTVMPSDRYDVRFEYTKATGALGAIFLMFKQLRQNDLREYKLYTGYGTGDMEQAYVYFRLVPQGPPSCPVNVSMAHVYSDKVTLSWTPGFNGGLRQYFIIERHDGVQVANVTDPEQGPMVYNITGMSKNTAYIFTINVWNAEGLTRCRGVSVTTLGDALKEDISSPINTVVIVVLCIVVGVLLVVVGTVAVLCRRKKKRQRRKINVYAIPEPISANDEHTYMTIQDAEQMYSVIDDGGENTESRVRSVGGTLDGAGYLQLVSLDRSAEDGYLTPVDVRPYRRQVKVSPTRVNDALKPTNDGYLTPVDVAPYSTQDKVSPTRVNDTSEPTNDGYLTPVDVAPYSTQDKVSPTRVDDNLKLRQDEYITPVDVAPYSSPLEVDPTENSDDAEPTDEEYIVFQ